MGTTSKETSGREHPEQPDARQDRAESELIAAALAALDSPLPGTRQPEAERASLSGEQGPASPTLAALDAGRRPESETVCESCPNSVWFSSPTQLKCYCRVMYLIVWSDKKPNRITACDGIFLGQEQ